MICEFPTRSGSKPTVPLSAGRASDVLFYSGKIAPEDQERDLRAVSNDLAEGRSVFMRQPQEGDAVNG
jgi:hypothetical protein